MTDHAKPGLEERLSRAINTRDLSADDPAKRQDSDYLGALGFASRGCGATTLRLHLSGSQADYRQARDGASEMAVTMGRARRWGLGERNLRKIGTIALAHHVFPACPHCKGVKFEVPEGSPYPSSAICQPCQGTGLRPVQLKWHHQINELMVALQTLDVLMARAIGGYLG